MQSALEKSKELGELSNVLCVRQAVQCIVAMLDGNLMLSLLHKHDTYLINQHEMVFSILHLKTF